MGLVDLRRFAVITRFNARDDLVVDHVRLEAEHDLEVRLTDVVAVNALAIPGKTLIKYWVLCNELRLLLSFLSDQPGHPLKMRAEDFAACAGHVKRFISESLGMGMLTAAVQSHYAWQGDHRSLANFDVLPLGPASEYPSKGTRPDLLFDFGKGEDRWRLAGEARGRSAPRGQAASISPEQRRRLDQIVEWSGCNDQHQVTMTWAYSGSDRIQVDLFDIRQPAGELPAPPGDRVTGTAAADDEMLGAVEQVAESRASVITAQLYDSAPQPGRERTVFGSHVRGDWVRADLLAPSELHLLLGILDHPLSPEEVRTIRHGRGTLARAFDHDQVQIGILERILIVIARGTSSPPEWPEIIESL